MKNLGLALNIICIATLLIIGGTIATVLTWMGE